MAALLTVLNLALICLFLLVLALLGLGYWISNLLMYPPRQRLSRTPADYGVAYEDVVFKSQDRCELKGWWIPAPRPASQPSPAPAVILLHPMFGNRQGFNTPRQGWLSLLHPGVDLLKVACSFHQAGYALLMFDFRGHGASQAGRCAGGLTEDQDVRGAVDYAFDRIAAESSARQTSPVGIVGFGLGASAAIAAVGREKGGAEVIRIFSADSEGSSGLIEIQPANVKKLRFLVAIQPASLGTLLRGYLNQIFPPLAVVLVPLVNRICTWRGGYPLDAAFLLKYARHVNVPVLYVQSRQDPWEGSEELQQLVEATSGSKQTWWIEESPTRFETHDLLGAQLESILAFAAQHISNG
jgi:pimeloyl-ACP methyl ester carboxylesterase